MASSLTHFGLNCLVDKPTHRDKVSFIALLDASELQSFTGRHFFDVNEVSIVFLWEVDIKTGEGIPKVTKTLEKAFEKSLEKVYNGL